MSRSFFVGVDGGASKCLIRVEDENGNLVGREKSGPANIRLSPTQAWQSIEEGLSKIMQAQGLSHHYDDQFHAGMGLAGWEVIEAYQAFISKAHSFHTLVVSSDAHVACLGAHAGQEGAIIVVGTGVIGFQQEGQQTVKVGGWGFPHDDEGGGAWLGLQAVKMSLQWLDGRLSSSDSSLMEAVYAHFHHDMPRFVAWANQANSTAFAELAPLVIHGAQQGDPTAIQIMQQAAIAIDQIYQALLAKQIDTTKSLPCALVGGIADFIKPFLNETLQTRLRPLLFSADAGAIFLVKEYGKQYAKHT